MTAGARSGINPDLEAILESIRQTLAGEVPGSADPGGDRPLEAPPAHQAEAARQRKPLRANLPPSDKTVEEFLADLIRPQVEAWLAAHLPEIVQQLAADEIRRLTGGK